MPKVIPAVPLYRSVKMLVVDIPEAVLPPSVARSATSDADIPFPVWCRVHIHAVFISPWVCPAHI